MTKEIQDRVFQVKDKIAEFKTILFADLYKLAEEIIDSGSKEGAHAYLRAIDASEGEFGREDSKDLMTSVGLHYDISAYVGDCGNGEYLIVKEDHYSGYDVGDWMSSSESC